MYEVDAAFFLRRNQAYVRVTQSWIIQRKSCSCNSGKKCKKEEKETWNEINNYRNRIGLTHKGNAKTVKMLFSDVNQHSYLCM
jgi:hypothetical protein